MGQVLLGSATTTEAVRRVIQNSEEGRRDLARRHGINRKTLARWSEAEEKSWMGRQLPAKRRAVTPDAHPAETRVLF